MLLLVILALLNLVTAAPNTHREYKSNCTALIENSPWLITKFVYFQTSKPKQDCQSYINFNFVDINKGLQINTTCNRYMPLYSNNTTSDDEWYPCRNKNVQFLFLNGTLQMSRWYEDPCLGDPPYNSGTAFGRIKTNLTRTRVTNGTFFTQTTMHVPITSLA